MPDLEWVVDPGRPALGWRWIGAGVAVEQSFAIAGGVASTAAFALAEGIGRRRCRRALRGAVQPQWRPLGALWVVTTNLRLMVLCDGAWASVWLGSVVEVEALADGVVLRFAADPAYRLRWA